MPPDSSEPGPPASPPFCYRHPDRETHLRCNRCGRPICPDCMIPASVGFQCPECVRGGNQSVRQVRTSVGAVLRPQNFPLVTYILIAVNFAVYGLQHVVGGEVPAPSENSVSNSPVRPLTHRTAMSTP